MEKYVPPYEITDEMLSMTSDIMELLGELKNVNDLDKLPRLRKTSRIKSIHSSLAIENNTLSLQQVTAVIEGKRVLGPKDDIVAVKNAFEAYKLLDDVNPYSVQDLERVHGVMMKGLVDECGNVRSQGVGIINSNGDVVHLAPPADLVHELLYQLFDWTKESNAHTLIKSCVFHYEFEFIHPFMDGNGRMGRLWQTALLADWKPIFKWIPIESIIRDNQQDYYNAITLSTSQGKSNIFILFMLDVIKSALLDIVNDTRNHHNHVSNQISALLAVAETYPMSLTELMNRVGLKSRDTFRKNYIVPALEAGLIGMTDPDHPTSKNQKYFKI